MSGISFIRYAVVNLYEFESKKTKLPKQDKQNYINMTAGDNSGVINIYTI